MFNFYCFEQAAFKYSFDGHAVIASLVPPHWPRGRGGVSASRPSSGPQLMQGRSTRARRSDVGTPPEPLFRPQSPRRLANGAAGGRRPWGVCSPAEGGAPVGPPPPSFREARAVGQSLRRRSSPRTVLGFVLPRALPPPQRRLRWRGRRFPPPRTSFGPQAADARVSRNPQATHTRPHHPTIHATTPTVLLFAGAAPLRTPALRAFLLCSPFAVSPTRPSVGVCRKRGARGHCLSLLPSPPSCALSHRHCRGSPRIPPPRCFRRSHRPGRCYSARFPEPFSSSPWTEPSAG